MNWKSVDIQHHALLNIAFYNNNKLGICDYTFSNLYIWRRGIKAYINILEDEVVFLKFIDLEGKTFYTLPLKIVPNDNFDLLAHINILKSEEKTALEFRAIDEEKAKFFLDNTSKYDIVEDRDAFDYVYNIDELINLEGKKYHSKKNHLNKFKENYKWEFVEINKNNAKCVEKTINEWCEKHKCILYKSLKYERFGIIDILNDWNTFPLKGGFIKIDTFEGEKIVAFTFGELIKDDFAIIHIEKADPEIRGSYNAINREFLFHMKNNYWKYLKYVNREEDLGLEGLRKAKLSYNPTYLLKKYKLFWK